MPDVITKLLFFQTAITAAAALIAALLGANGDWRAALAGGGIVIAATWLSARRAFAAKPGSSPERMMAALMRGEVVKFVFIAVAVLICIKLMHGGYLVLMATLFTTLLAHHFALLWISKRPVSQQK